MTAPLASHADWRDRTAFRITIRPIWLAAVISVLGHLIVLWFGLPHLRLSIDPKLPGDKEGRFDVVLAPPPRPPTPPPPIAAPAPPPPSPPTVKPAPRTPPKPPAAVRPPPAPPVLAMKTPSPAKTPAPPPPAPPATQPPDMSDFMSNVEARRRARAESQPQIAAAPSGPPTENDTARANRNLAASIASQQPKDFGDPSKSGGIFSVTRQGLNDAELVFYGWSFEARRNLPQPYAVKRGNNPTIEIATVRKMIEIIRQYETGYFQWESKRQGRWVTLSAAQRDTAGLESFLMRDFF